MDVSAVIEEIALEGLDGITINALWLRLKNRPGLHLESIDEHVKKYVWKHLCQSTEIEFFQLENPRSELVITEYDSLVQENRCCFADEFPLDIYSFKIVDKNGIYGCCDDFESRVPVSRDIRSEDGTALITVDQAMERWGQRLTIVASQKLRFQALLLTNYLPTGINAEAYAVVERIGRSRYIGEPTKVHDRPGLVNDMMTSSNLFAIIKHLCSCGYLVKQPFNLYLETKGRYYHARLVHLRHFYRRSIANTDAYIDSVCKFLQGMPNMMALPEVVSQEFGIRFKDITRHLGPRKSPIVVDTVPYRSVYSDATEEQYSDKNGEEKMLKVLRLTEPYKVEDANDEEDKDDEEREEAEEYPDNSCKKESGEILAGQYLYDLSMPSAITHMIEQSGTSGISEAQLRQRLHAPLKVAEQVLRGLLKANVIVKSTQQIGTLRQYKYMVPEAAKIFKQMLLEKTEEQSDADKLNASQDSNPSQELSQEGGASEADVDSKEEKEDTTSIDTTIQSLNMSWVIQKTDAPKPVDEMAMKRKERRDYILRRLAKCRVCKSDVNLFNEMIEWEKRRGWKEKMCRKSFQRIIKDLYEEGKISHVKITCSSSSEQKCNRFLGDINLKEDELVLKKAAVQHYTYRIKYQTVKAQQSLQEKDDTEVLLQPVSVIEMLQKAARGSKAKHAKTKKKLTRKVSKFHFYGKGEKAQMLHEFMFYLLYDYKGDPKAADILETDEERKEPPVYLDVRDWRRYVPPLKIHNSAMFTKMIPGSCMIGDLLMSIPVCIFFKLISIACEVEGLKAILEDDDKKLYPLIWLPSEVLSTVMESRNYMKKLNNTIRFLCYLGLLSYGPKLPIWHVEYVIVYLHKKAMVLNTTTSLPAYDMIKCPEGQEFSKIHFHFDGNEKVKKFWQEIYLICIGSNLGGRGLKPEITKQPDKSGKPVKVNLLDVTRPREFSEIQEDEWLPGDRMGACGFDSSLFLHYVRCWKSNVTKEPRKRKRVFAAHRKVSSTVTGSIGEGHTQKKIKRVHFEKPTKTSRLLKKEAKKFRRKHRLPAGTVAPRKKYVKLKQVLDDEDKQAKREMDRLRARFSPLENGIVLICHVAYQIMNPGGLAHSVPHRNLRLAIREFLPGVFKDKTQFAVRNRFTRYAADKNFIRHIPFYLAKARYDKEIMSKYRDSGGNLALPELFDKYIELIKVLYNKFSSPDSPLGFPFPSTVAELHREYDQVDTTKICERERKKVNFDCQHDSDIQSLSLWNLLLGWMYNPIQVSNCEMYYSFCQFSMGVICNTRDLLKHAGVITMTKKSAGEETDATHQSPGVIHNMALTLRHKKAMESQYPVDVFENALKQIEALEEVFWLKKSAAPSISDALNRQSKSGDIVQPDPQQTHQGGSPVGQISTQGQKQDTEDSQEEEVYEELDWKQYQGGCSMAVLTLFALDMVNVKIFIPDDMIHVSEDAKKNFSFKKGKRPAEDMEEEANESNDDDLRPPLKSMRTNINLQQRSKSPVELAETLQASTSTSSLDNAGEGTSRSGQDTLKQVKEGASVISFKPTNVAGAGTLANHAVSMASGTLLTLAKTSMIERLDIANSKYKFTRLFIVEPLKIEFALKAGAQAKTIGSENKGNEDECEMDCEQGSKDCPAELHIDSFEKGSTRTNVCSEQPLYSKVESPLSIQSKQSGKSTTKNSCFTRISKADFSEIFSRLEQVFPLDYDQTDVSQEIRKCLPSPFVEKGEKLYQLIDSYGFPGITELEIEQSQGMSYSSLTSLIKCLCDMNAEHDEDRSKNSGEDHLVNQQFERSGSESWILPGILKEPDPENTVSMI